MKITPAPEVRLAKADVPALLQLPKISSNVLAWLYQVADHPSHACLWVRYKGGNLYRYWSVPPILWETLRLAPSIGGMLHDKVVANPDYRCERVLEMP